MKDKKRFGVFDFFALEKNVLQIVRESFILFISFVFLAAIIGQIISAATLNCSVMNASSCVSPNITIFRLLNESGGYYNAHAQNATLSGYSPIYNYSLCCSSDYTLSATCSEAIVLKLFNYTNANVQFGNYSGPNTTYTYSSCLSASPGAASCTYSSGSCAGGYSCLASIASSEGWANNQTNAHVGPCSEYNTKVCCRLNSPPVISNVVLNSTYGTNYTYENLTVYFAESDADGDAYTNITDWRKNGTSIAVLNIAFNTNTSSTSTGAIRDYSTYGNNGTLGGGTAANAPTWTSSGKAGGAYAFDGVNDYIDIGNNRSLTPNNTLSVSLWVKPYATQNTYSGLAGNFNSYSGWIIRYSTSNQLSIRIGNGTTHQDFFSSGSTTTNNWTHMAFVYNGSGIIYYFNGINETVRSSNIAWLDYLSADVLIGSDGLTANRYFNGTIDEVQIFNYSLSANQIAAMYRAGVENHSVQMIHSDETTKGEAWGVAVTGNDGFDDGTSVLSNNLTIRGSVPNVTLLSPPDGNETRSRTPTFYWNATDVDGDAMTYEINITPVKFAGQFVCSDDIDTYSGVMNYTPASDLECFYDNSYYYLWSVRANDSDGQGGWAGPWKLNMTAVVDMSMPVNFVSFGQLSLLQDDNTTDNSPPPFQIQNDGNALININVTSTNLWNSIVNPNQYYKFKINNNSGELGSFNWGNSTTTWTSLPSSITNVSGIALLKYQDAFDSAIIDMLVQTPPAEPPGNKTATVTFMSILAE
jgi:hypothetical protein